MLRTEIAVEAPARTSYTLGGRPMDRRAESWVVEVRQEPLAVGYTYTVQARNVWADTPQGRRPIPGLVVPSEPTHFTTLGRARKDARRLADVLSGQLRPKYTETHYA